VAYAVFVHIWVGLPSLPLYLLLTVACRSSRTQRPLVLLKIVDRVLVERQFGGDGDLSVGVVDQTGVIEHPLFSGEASILVDAHLLFNPSLFDTLLPDLENAWVLCRIDQGHLIISVDLVEFDNLAQIIEDPHVFAILVSSLHSSSLPLLFLPTLKGILVEFVCFHFPKHSQSHVRLKQRTHWEGIRVILIFATRILNLVLSKYGLRLLFLVTSVVGSDQSLIVIVETSVEEGVAQFLLVDISWVHLPLHCLHRLPHRLPLLLLTLTLLLGCRFLRDQNDAFP
jgi:hypothetical protein